MKKIKVFVSSPQDVELERNSAQRVFSELNKEFIGRAKLEGFFWEDGVLQFHSSPQTQTPLTSEYDVLLCILWKRLGSMLDPGQFLHPDTGEPYPSGTAFEVETALRSFDSNKKKPVIYLFRRTAEKLVPVNSETMQWGAQYDALEKYYRHLLGREYLKRSSNEFSVPVEFEEKLRVVMRAILREAVDGETMQRSQVRKAENRQNPFRSLRPFNFGDERFFFGREEAVEEVVAALRKQDENGIPFLMIFGGSGLGKSSLVRAGVLHRLHSLARIPGVRFWRHVILKPGRDPSVDLFRLLAGAIFGEKPKKVGHSRETSSALDHLGEKDDAETDAKCSQPLPELARGVGADGVSLDVESFAELLREDPVKAEGLIAQALREIGAEVSIKENTSGVSLGRLVIVVDQFEEIFHRGMQSPPGGDLIDPASAAFLETLEELAKRHWIWVIATARSDYFQQCESWPRLCRMKQGDGTYHLSVVEREQLREVISKPVEAVDMEFEAEDGRSLIDMLVDDAGGDAHSLPLLEFALSELYERTPKNERIIKIQSYKELGRVNGVLARRARESFEKVFPVLQDDVADIPVGSPAKSRVDAALARYGEEAMRCFGALARSLVSIGKGEGERPVRNSPPKDLLCSDPASGKARLAEQLISDRLLYVEQRENREGVTVTVAHEVLLECWPMLKDWIEQHRQELVFRDQIVSDAHAWEASGEEPKYLYTDEVRAARARTILQLDFLDTDLTKRFLTESVAAEGEKNFMEELLAGSTNAEFASGLMLVGKSRQKVLLEALRNQSKKTVRQNAAAFVGNHAKTLVEDDPDTPLLPELVSLVIDDPDQTVRRTAAESLVKVKDEKLFDRLFDRLEKDQLSFSVIGGIARVQIAAERCTGSVDLSKWTARFRRVQEFRIWLRVRAVRFIAAIPVLIFTLIAQLVLAGVSAGAIKMASGYFSYSIVQGDRSAGAGIFGGITAALFWGSSITLGIAVYRLVFARRDEIPGLKDPVPLGAYFRPFGSLVAGGLGGGIGSCIIISIIASVFTSEALYSMGWTTALYAKSDPTYAGTVWSEILFRTGYAWPHLFTGMFLGVGMAMMANGLLSSAKWWQKCQVQDTQGVDFRQLWRLFWNTFRSGLRYAWPIPVALIMAWGAAFGLLRFYWNPPPVEIAAGIQDYKFAQQCGWDPFETHPDRRKRVEEAIKSGARTDLSAEESRRQVDAQLLKENLRFWKISPSGQGIGIACDELAQGVGGFFCIVGLAMVVVASTRGFYVEPYRD